VDLDAATLTPEAYTVFAEYGGAYLWIPSTVTNETTRVESKHPFIIRMNNKSYVASVIPGADPDNLKNYISIYQVTKGRAFDEYILGNPARDINGLFHRYIKKNTPSSTETGPATVPASLTVYASLSRNYNSGLAGETIMDIQEVVTLNREALAFLKSVSSSVAYMTLQNGDEEDYLGDAPQAVFTINDKHYIFWLTPQAGLSGTEEDVEYTTHPVNSQISAYEVTVAEQAFVPANRQPARAINALLADYLAKKTGASRRRTFRRARTHGALHVVGN
jgi:hypothetical protein